MGFIGIPVRHFDRDPDVEMVLSYKIIRIENGKIISHEGFTHPDLTHVRYGYRLFRGTYIGEKKGLCYYSNNIVLKDKDGGNRLLIQYSEIYNPPAHVNVMHRWLTITR